MSSQQTREKEGREEKKEDRGPFDERAKAYFSKFGLIEFRTHQRKIQTVAWNSEGEKKDNSTPLLAVGSADPQVYVYPCTSTELGEPRILSGHTDGIKQVMWAPKPHSNILATASLDKTVKVWDMRAHSKPIKSFTNEEPLCINWSPDGQQLGMIVKGHNDDIFIAYDLRGSTDRKVVDKKFQKQLNQFTWTASGNEVMFATKKGTVILASYPKMKTISFATGHTGPCYSIALDNTGRKFTTSSMDATVAIWDALELVCVRTLYDMEQSVNCTAWSYCGRIVAYAGDDGDIHLAVEETGKVVHKIKVNFPVGQMAWNNKWTMAFAPKKEED
eukprot:Ihof_evm1s165 gene=Ihof_evmTU1s165